MRRAAKRLDVLVKAGKVGAKHCAAQLSFLRKHLGL